MADANAFRAYERAATDALKRFGDDTEKLVHYLDKNYAGRKRDLIIASLASQLRKVDYGRYQSFMTALSSTM